MRRGCRSGAAPAADPVAAALAEALGESAPSAGGTLSAEGQAGVADAPPPRPDALADAGVPALAQDAAAIPLAEIDPATLSPGTRLAQLGAFDSVEDARGEWVKLTNRYGDLLAGRSLVIQAGQSGGRTFYRLRAASFPTEEKTRSFCASLVERGVQCIPVIHE